MGFFSKLLPRDLVQNRELEARVLQEIESDMIACGWTEWERNTTVKMLKDVCRQMAGARDSDLLCGSREETIRAQYRVAKEQQRRMRAFDRGEIAGARLTSEEIAALLSSR
jgi:hypothetical protein